MSDAQRKLVQDNLGLVSRYAREFLPRAGGKLELDDLEQEGAIGLMRAVKLFDPALGFAFSTYASNWIKQSIRRAIRAADLVRIPEHLWPRMERLEEREWSIKGERGRAADDGEIGESLGWRPRRMAMVRAGAHAKRRTLTVDPACHDDTDVFRPPVDPQSREDAPTARAEASEQREQLSRAVAALSPARRIVVAMVVNGLSYEAISARLGITNKSVGQRYRDAIPDLRAWLSGRPPVHLPRGAKPRKAAAAGAEGQS